MALNVGTRLGHYSVTALIGEGVPHGVHILRHTYCSHLAMRGGSARSIQEPAGHQNLATTQRYMHLTPATLEATVRLLNQPIDVPAVGDILETGRSQMTN